MDTVSNGSIVHVYPNQFMMLVDGGKVVDYTAEGRVLQSGQLFPTIDVQWGF